MVIKKKREQKKCLKIIFNKNGEESTKLYTEVM